MARASSVRNAQPGAHLAPLLSHSGLADRDMRRQDPSRRRHAREPPQGNAMELRVTPLMPGFAAQIEGVEAARASKADVAAIRAAMREFAVVVLPDQHMSEADQVAFGAAF